MIQIRRWPLWIKTLSRTVQGIDRASAIACKHLGAHECWRVTWPKCSLGKSLYWMAMPASAAEDGSHSQWQCVPMSRVGWQASVPVCFHRACQAGPTDSLWEFRSFFYQVFPAQDRICTWLDMQGKNRKYGHASVEKFIKASNARTLATCQLVSSSQADPASNFPEYMCTTGWLLCWLLIFPKEAGA